MHIITECPRCKMDFMYHSKDVYLHRAVAFDADTKEPCSFETAGRGYNRGWFPQTEEAPYASPH